MLVQLNRFLRTSLSPVHRLAKALVSSWMESEDPVIPAFRSLNGVWLRLHPRYLVLDLDGLEPEAIAWIKISLKAGDVALDIGANVGLHSLWMAHWTGPGGAVFAFEPSPANLKVLRYHQRINHLKQMHILPCAVAQEHGGQVPFFLISGGDSPSNSLTFVWERVLNLPQDDALTRQEVCVDQVSVDGFCRDQKVQPALIKIDVEGAELMVLRGSSATPDAARPAVVLAIHPWWLPEGQSTEDIVRFLKQHRYIIRDRNNSQVETLEYAEYLCLPAERFP